VRARVAAIHGVAKRSGEALGAIGASAAEAGALLRAVAAVNERQVGAVENVARSADSAASSAREVTNGLGAIDLLAARIETSLSKAFQQTDEAA